jgi:serine/threonine-protein kinase
MSPEQCAGGHVDFYADIYALGVVVFELLTGSLPFTGTNAMQLTSQHLVAPPPPPSSRRPELLPEVDAVVLRMLAKSPQQRPASATEAVRGLAQALEVSPSSGAREGLQSAENGAASAPQTAESSAQSAGGSGAVAASEQPASLEPRRASPKLMALIALGCAAAVAGTALVWPRHHRTEPAVKAAPAAVAPARIAETPAAPAPPPPSRPASEPQIERVRVVVAGEPASAKIFRGTEQVGRIGVPFELPRSAEGVRLFVRAPNYNERELRIVPSEDRNLHVMLKRISARRSTDLEY